MVMIIFYIPAASSKSERVFSVAGRIVTPSRGQDSPGAGGELGDYEVQHEAPEGDENQPVNNVNILFLLDSVVLTCVPVYKQ